MRRVPQPGDPVEIVHLADAVPATVVAVDGPRVEVRTDAGAVETFVLHPRTGRFVRAGEPYWGVRLRLR